jgi:hypothetical protein
LITHSESLSQIAEMDLKPQALQALLHDTAAKVFKLPELVAPQPAKAAAGAPVAQTAE